MLDGNVDFTTLHALPEDTDVSREIIQDVERCRGELPQDMKNVFGAIFPLKQPDGVGLSDDDKIELGIEFTPDRLDL